MPAAVEGMVEGRIQRSVSKRSAIEEPPAPATSPQRRKAEPQWLMIALRATQTITIAHADDGQRPTRASGELGVVGVKYLGQATTDRAEA